jgi:hypothetical protein
MRTRTATALLAAVLLCGCAADNPSPLRLAATLSPNPLRPPDAEGWVFWDLELRASGSGTVLVEQATVLLFNAAGVRVGENRPFYSRSAGCTVCTTDVTIEPGRSTRFSGNRSFYVGGGAPVRLVYTVSYTDDLGKGSATAEVPVSTAP